MAQISHGEIEGDNLVMYNVRNFDYRSVDDFDQKWETRTYNLKNLQGLDLFLSYWASDHIAHTVLSWDFGVDGHLAVSIETRKDITQAYSAVKGFFKQFEICYIAADERDMIRLRTNYRKERVYLYRLQVPNEQVLALFKDYLKKNYTHYFYNMSFWYKGFSRNVWNFWKKDIGIFEPSIRERKKGKKTKVRPYSCSYENKFSDEEIKEKTFYFKRLPKRWIPEFDRL